MKYHNTICEDRLTYGSHTDAPLLFLESENTGEGSLPCEPPASWSPGGAGLGAVSWDFTGILMAQMSRAGVISLQRHFLRKFSYNDLA